MQRKKRLLFRKLILQRPFFSEVGKENCLFGTPRRDHCSIIYNLYQFIVEIGWGPQLWALAKVLFTLN